MRDINNQIYKMNGGNMIILNENMSNEEIINIIKYYLENKDILVYINIKAKLHFVKYNNMNYLKSLNDIIENENFNLKYENINKNYIFSKEIINFEKCDFMNNIDINSNKVKENNLNFIILNKYFEEGEYIITMNNSNNLLIETDGNISIYRKVIIDNIYYFYFKIDKSAKIKINFNINTLSNLRIARIFKKNIKKNIYYTSKGCPEIAENLASRLYGNIISKDDLWNGNAKKFSNREKLIIIGFYDPWKWKTMYKPYLNLLNRLYLFYVELIYCNYWVIFSIFHIKIEVMEQKKEKNYYYI